METTAGYEFTDQQNQVFKGLVSGMRRSGAVIAIASLILLAYQLVQHFGVSMKGEQVKAAYYLDVGIWCMLAGVGVVVAALLVKATSAFTAVIETQGDDIQHLMSGLEKLQGILGLIFWTAVLGSVLLATSFALLLTGKA